MCIFMLNVYKMTVSYVFTKKKKKVVSIIFYLKNHKVHKELLQTRSLAQSKY